jgi:dTDP-4-dehydrorhamnose 3,5-epimerase
MTDPISKNQILDNQQGRVFVQDYSKKPVIEGVKVVEMRNMVGEDGDLTEIFHLNEHGESEEFPGFFLKQVNRSLVMPGAIKAWHLHFNQDDIWHILPHDRLTVALWDTRKDSPTSGVTMKLALGGGKSHAVYIPRGVAHGTVNHSQNPATIMYFVNQKFDLASPDENRLPWDSLGANFWDAPKE